MVLTLNIFIPFNFEQCLENHLARLLPSNSSPKNMEVNSIHFKSEHFSANIDGFLLGFLLDFVPF